VIIFGMGSQSRLFHGLKRKSGESSAVKSHSSHYETQSDPPTASQSRVAVDEKQIEVDGE